MLIQSIALDLWKLARPTLAIVAFIVIFRLLFLRNFVLDWRMLLAAVLFTTIGLYLFLKGVSAGLIPLCESTGNSLVDLSYKLPVVIFVCIIGYLSTLLEPGLRTVAQQVEEVSSGAIRQHLLVHTAALGFAMGAGLGVIRILSPFSMKIAAVVSLLILLVLVLISPEHVVGIAFDCASASTGPANIAILLGLAIGLSQMVSGGDPIRQGFGLIALTAYGTTSAVMILGILESHL